MRNPRSPVATRPPPHSPPAAHHPPQQPDRGKRRNSIGQPTARAGLQPCRKQLPRKGGRDRKQRQASHTQGRAEGQC